MVWFRSSPGESVAFPNGTEYAARRPNSKLVLRPWLVPICAKAADGISMSNPTSDVPFIEPSHGRAKAPPDLESYPTKGSAREFYAVVKARAHILPARLAFSARPRVGARVREVRVHAARGPRAARLPALQRRAAPEPALRLLRRGVRGRGRHPRAASPDGRADRERARLLRAGAVPGLSAAGQLSVAARARRAQRAGATARPGDPGRRAHRRGGLRDGPDELVPRHRGPGGDRGGPDPCLARAGRGRAPALRDRSRPLRRDRPALSRTAGRSIRRRLLERRAAPHAGSARFLRRGGAPAPAGRNGGGGALQCVRAPAAPAAARGGAIDGFPLDPLGPRAARATRRAGPPRGLVARPVPPRRGAPPHPRRGAGLVPREPRRVLARVSRHAPRRRAADRRRPVPGRRGRLAGRERAGPALLGAHAVARGRPLRGGRARGGALGSRHAPRALLGRLPLTVVLRGGRAPPLARAGAGRQGPVRPPRLSPPPGRRAAPHLRRVRRLAPRAGRGHDARARIRHPEGGPEIPALQRPRPARRGGGPGRAPGATRDDGGPALRRHVS